MTEIERMLDDAKAEIAQLETEIEQLTAKTERLQTENADLNRQINNWNNWYLSRPVGEA